MDTVFQFFFHQIPGWINQFFRVLDFRANASYGTPLHGALGFQGHAPASVLLLIPIVWFVAAGISAAPFDWFKTWPGADSAAGILLIFLAALLLVFFGWLGSDYYSEKHLGLAEWAVLVTAALATWFLFAPPVFPASGTGWLREWLIGGSGAREADGAPYRHAFIPFALGLVTVSLILAHWLSRRLFPFHKLSWSRANRELANTLPKVDLTIPDDVPARTTLVNALHALINGPLYHPLHLFLPSALGVFLARSWDQAIVTGVLLFLASFLVLAAGSVHDRWDVMIKVVHRWFFVGGQLVVSLVVIGLATARVLDVQYVSTVLDTQSSVVVMLYVVAAYTLFWFNEYWINRMLCERLIAVFRCASIGVKREASFRQVSSGRVAFQLLPESGAKGSRCVQIHAGARFVEIASEPEGTHCEAPGEAAFEKLELFARLIEQTEKEGGTSVAHTANAADDTGNARRAYNDLKNRVKLYFNILNLVLVTGFAIFAWSLYRTVPVPLEETYALPESSHASALALFDLRKRLLPGAKNGRVVMVAASGGGTRAAFYTASVLYGLQRMNALNDLVLASGVSGGSAALAYYAIHHNQLRSDQQWRAFLETMGEEYIQDVLEGVLEWRIVGSAPLGQLLKESMDRRFYADGSADVQYTLGEVTDFGLIFNTALAGHPYSVSKPLEENFAPKPDAFRRSYGTESGGRLIYTNLNPATVRFPRVDTSVANPNAVGSDWSLHYVALHDPRVRLTTAAASSANFPPVFSNLPIDIQDGQEVTPGRYWVTDGGATDNRGLVSLLMALRSALIDRSGTCLAGGEGGDPVGLPDIHIVVAEASAITVDYIDDRGIGAKFGAADKFASRLMDELMADIRSCYVDTGGGRVELYYLGMPLVFRSRGGVGTHWMMPERVVLADPKEPDPEKFKWYRRLAGLSNSATLEVHRDRLASLIEELHDPDRPFCSSEASALREQDEVRAWICTDQNHRREWNRIKANLASETGPK